jgi:TP901 family phage tail tape measure protein
VAGTLPPIVGIIRIDASQASKGISGFTRDLETASKRGQSAFQVVGQHAEKGLLRVSQASLLAGAGAIKMAMDYDQSLTHIKGLVGASQQQTDAWSKQLLDMAPKVGKAPKELADALYFVTSSGVDAADAMGVVKVSAEAAASGLGQTETVADAVTSAMNAYGPKTLSAAAATDVLVATVREGKGEPEQLAGALGRVIAPAQAMGITFGQVGGAVAALSLIMPDVSEDVTGLRGILTAISAPGDKATETLHQFGLSMEGIQETIRTKGLLAGLTEITTATKGNQAALHAIFPDVRAFNAMQILTGANLEKNKGIIDRVTKSTGSLDKAFGEVSKDPTQQFHQAMAGLQADGIKLGNALLPAATELVGDVGKIADAFSQLPEGAQVAVLGVGLLAGPVLKVTRLLIDGRAAWMAYRGAKLAQVAVDAEVAASESMLATRVATTQTSLAASVGLVGAAVAAGAYKGSQFDGQLQQLHQHANPLATALDKLFTATEIGGRKTEQAAHATADLTRSYQPANAALLTGQHHALGMADAMRKGAEGTKAAGSAARSAAPAHKLDASSIKEEAQAMSSIIPLFGGYERNKKLSTASILKSLRQERDAFRDWAVDTRTLIRRGADPELIQALAQKGPQYVHLFATGSDRQLAALKSIFQSRTAAAGDAARAVAAAKGAQAGSAAASAMERNFHPHLVVTPIINLPASLGAYRYQAHRQMASGGILDEPVLGVGLRTGTKYTLAERGPEAVTPLQGGPPSGASVAGLRGGPRPGGGVVVNVTVNVVGQVGDADAIARKLADPVRRELLRLAPRLGSLWGSYA